MEQACKRSTRAASWTAAALAPAEEDRDGEEQTALPPPNSGATARSHSGSRMCPTMYRTGPNSRE
jgi:hypothetical protein